jgi:hypothetical protein
MFSTFTSFLPSALQMNGNTHDNHTTTTPTSPKPIANPEMAQEYKQPAEEDTGAKKGSMGNKSKSAYEVCVIIIQYLQVLMSFRRLLSYDHHQLNQITRSIFRFNLYHRQRGQLVNPLMTVTPHLPQLLLRVPLPVALKLPPMVLRLHSRPLPPLPQGGAQSFLCTTSMLIT